MRGFGTVLKSLDRSNNTVLFNYIFPYLEGFCQQVLAPLQFLSYCAMQVFYVIWRFMQKDCECVRVAVLFQGDLRRVTLTLRNLK